METEDFPCPKCSQLNIANRTTCKDCGADLSVALAGIEPIEKVAGRRSTLILYFIMAVSYPRNNNSRSGAQGV